MRRGDLLFVRGKSLVSRLIRQVTGGHYNHVEIWLGQGRSVGAHLGKGVILSTPAADFKGEDMAWGQVLAASDKVAAEVADLVERMVGTQYDARGLLGVWLRFALLRIGLALIDSPSGEDHKFFCSELASWGYLQKEVKIVDLDPSLTSPTDLKDAPGVVVSLFL